MKSASSNTDDADTETSVQESVVQVGAFKGRHAAIFSGFAVEDEVDGKQGTTENSTAIDEALGEVSRGSRVGEGRWLLISSTERVLKGVAEGAS